MDDVSELPAPTSDAGTSETEPEVVAGISSAAGSPGLPLSVHANRAHSAMRGMLLVAAGVGLGFAAARLLWRGD